METQENVVIFHTTDKVKFCALQLWSISHQISSTGPYQVCLLCDLFLLRKEILSSDFYLDFNRFQWEVCSHPKQNFILTICSVSFQVLETGLMLSIQGKKKNKEKKR